MYWCCCTTSSMPWLESVQMERQVVVPLTLRNIFKNVFSSSSLLAAVVCASLLDTWVLMGWWQGARLGRGGKGGWWAVWQAALGVSAHITHVWIIGYIATLVQRQIFYTTRCPSRLRMAILLLWWFGLGCAGWRKLSGWVFISVDVFVVGIKIGVGQSVRIAFGR